jgi:hypothetical protein
MPSLKSKPPAPSPEALRYLIAVAIGGQEDLEFLDQEAQNLKLEDFQNAVSIWQTYPPSRAVSLLESQVETETNLSLRQMNWLDPESLNPHDLNLVGLALLNVVANQFENLRA